MFSIDLRKFDHKIDDNDNDEDGSNNGRTVELALSTFSFFLLNVDYLNEIRPVDDSLRR